MRRMFVHGKDSHTLTRRLLLLCVAMLLAGEMHTAWAEAAAYASEVADSTGVTVSESLESSLTTFRAYPSVTRAQLVTDAQGYAINGEYVYQNEATGEYHYISPVLQVHITRHEDTQPKVVWHEAQIYARDGTLFRVWPFDTEKPTTKTAHQTVIAQKNHLVFAINSDFSHLRIGWKAVVGLLIRGGNVISTRTFKDTTKRYPTLDNLALLPDGSMLALERNLLTIEDYTAMGAYDLLAFGPVLIHEGEINTAAFTKYGWERAPRTAIGMVTKGHYVSIMVEGRHADSKGWSTTHLAEHMAALGATEALNLDGGQSATMMFMGKQIVRIGNSKSLTAKPRKSTEVLGVGQSKLVWSGSGS